MMVFPSMVSATNGKPFGKKEDKVWTLIIPFILFLSGLRSIILDEYDVPSIDNVFISFVKEFCTVLFAMFCIEKLGIVLFPNFKSSLSSDDVNTTPIEKEVGIQTEDRNFLKETDVLRRRHEKEIRTINREVRLLRRKFAEKFSKAKELVGEKNSMLSKLQLKIPQLQKEKTSLLDEKGAIEKQLAEEKQHNQELRSKFARIHGQMMRGIDNHYYPNRNNASLDY